MAGSELAEVLVSREALSLRPQGHGQSLRFQSTVS